MTWSWHRSLLTSPTQVPDEIKLWASATCKGILSSTTAEETMHYFLTSETPVFPGAKTTVEEQSRPADENTPFCLTASTASVLFFPTLEWVRTPGIKCLPWGRKPQRGGWFWNKNRGKDLPDGEESQAVLWLFLRLLKQQALGAQIRGLGPLVKMCMWVTFRAGGSWSAMWLLSTTEEEKEGFGTARRAYPDYSCLPTPHMPALGFLRTGSRVERQPHTFWKSSWLQFTTSSSPTTPCC